MIIYMLLVKFVNLVKDIKILHLEDHLEWIDIINLKLVKFLQKIFLKI